MPIEVVDRIATEVFSSAHAEEPFAFLWHLGEPLAVPPSFYEEAFAHIEQAGRLHQCAYMHSFQTNATLIDERWIDLIRRHDVKLGISVDGPDFIHDRQRVHRDGRGTHAETMRGIKLVRQAGIPFSVITVLTDFALDYPDEMFNFYRDHRIDDVGFNIDEIEGVHTSTTFAGGDAVGRYQRFLCRMLDLALADGGSVKMREVWTNLRTLALGGANPQNTTNQPWRILNFAADGNFSTFCPELVAAASDSYKNFVMGNILTGSLDQLQDNAIFKRVHGEIEKGKELCKATCEHWNFCGGGSPSNKFFEHGRFDVAETRTCKIQKKTTVDVLVDYLESHFAEHGQLPPHLLEQSHARVD